MTEIPTPPNPPKHIQVKEFFESVPPGQRVRVKDMGSKELGQFGSTYKLNLPVLELHCTTNSCNGVRYFEPTDSKTIVPGQHRQAFATFLCRNCRATSKTYAFSLKLDGVGLDGELFKYGESPSFGPPTPRRVLDMLGSEKEYYLKGRRSENQGLGIAAFAYYRRVVENQKNIIFDEIIKVSELVGASKEMLEDLKNAKKENQFSKAVGVVKHGIPQALLIEGHNPLTLLHAALSEGMHAQTDEQCLELATSIRALLVELVDRLASALKKEAELTAAVGRLLKTKAKDSSKSG